MADGQNGGFHEGLPCARELASRYTSLLDLYAELEVISETVLRAIEDTLDPYVVNGRLREKMAVADRIVAESRAIASLKQKLAEGGGLWEDEREQVHELESRLTNAVNRMVEQENRGRDLVMRRGMRVARR